MRRLVYSPKVWAWVKSDAQTDPINLSDHIVSGSVGRVINQVSTAELTIRNPQRKWSEGWKTGQGPLIRPMDPITIWMQRLSKRPVQVFSGYLDEAPYYQMYPGTVTLKASCTLKRLLHTYFDPALPYFHQFMNQYGWHVDPTTGQIMSDMVELSLDPKEKETRSNPDQDNDDKTNVMIDGSFGRLLFSSLKHIGGWHPNNIWIESLPTGLPELVAEIYAQQIQSQKDMALNESLNDFFKKIIGANWVGGGGGSSSGTDGGGSGGQGFRYVVPEELEDLDKIFPPHGLNNTEGKFRMDEASIRAVAEVAGFSPGRALQMAQIARGESSYYPGIIASDNGIGLFQITPWACGPLCRQWIAQVGGDEALRNPFKNAVIAKKLYDGGGFAPWFGTQYLDRGLDVSNVPSVLKDGGGSKDTDDDGDKSPGRSSRGDACYPLGQEGALIADSADHAARAMGNWMSDNAVDVAAPVGTSIHAVDDGTIYKLSGAYGSESTMTNGYRVYLRSSDNEYSYMHMKTVDVKVGDKVKSCDKLGTSGSANNVAHLHLGVLNGKPEPILDGELPDGGTVGDSGGDAAGGGGGMGGRTSPPASAFAAYFNFPQAANIAEATQLTDKDGQQKSLMNDEPLLPFIQQLCQASMRNFQSLPNGNFFAFFPDYFGTMNHRNAYWNIKDIEILDGTIELTDDNLATHVYAVGDTFGTGVAGQPIGFQERLASTGVVTLWNAGIFNFINGKKGGGGLVEKAPKRPGKGGAEMLLDKSEEATSNALFDPDTTRAFLTRYGARPYIAEMPFIRSHYFEAFLGYQEFMLMWSRQFLTTFQFTFMPELYPGGIVRLKDHNIQMYVEEVRHDFNYETGFTTQVNLSSPAAINDEMEGVSEGMVRSRAFKPV